MPLSAVSDTQSLPPVVLLLDDEPDILEMYSTHFQAEGVWVATAVSAREGMAVVEELRPDVVITDIGFGAELSGATFVEALRARADDTSRTPLIVLTGLPPVDLPGHVRRDADLFLRKPVAPNVLLTNVQRLLESVAALRVRSERSRTRAEQLRKTSEELLGTAKAIAATPASRRSRCPGCIEPLRWIETGTIDGRSFEYYDWCERGCGLYCFDAVTGAPIKLA